MKTLFSILIIINFISLNSNGQNTIPDTLSHKSPPIVRHDFSSSLPDTIHVVGYIVAEPAPGYCGIFCLGGTIKVALKKKIPGYKNKYAYLVTACLGMNVKVNAKVNVVASKLKNKEPDCYYNSIINGFDSNGFPFYKLSEKETAKVH